MKPELISFKLCPFVQKALLTLLYKGISYNIEYIDLDNPPAWFGDLSPLGKVPVLKVGNQVLFESSVIIEYLDEAYAKPLHPDDLLIKAQNRSWMEFGNECLMNSFNLIIQPDESGFNEQREILFRRMGQLEKQLDNTLVDKMGDQAPLLTDLSRPLKNYQQSAKAEQEKTAQAEVQAAQKQQPETVDQPEPANDVPPVEQKAAPRKPAAAVQPVSSGAIESEADSKKSLRQLQAASRDIAAFWVNQKLSDPRSYRLTRVAAWMVVENAPPANEGVTQVLPPAAERLKFFETTLQKADYSTLVIELEKTLARSPFWLDGHFLVVKALRALGAEYDKAVKTVIRETANFLNRLPEMVELSFSDQTPFASDQTRMWLDAEVLVASSADDSAGGATGGTAESWDVALVEAGKKAASGETGQAVSIMQQGLQQAGQQRDQMYWRCALAQLLMQLGDTVPAVNILEQICIQMDEDQLSIWEPGLLAHTYYLLFQSYQKQSKKNKDDKCLAEKMDTAYEKLCWFDPVTALSVKGG